MVVLQKMLMMLVNKQQYVSYMSCLKFKINFFFVKSISKGFSGAGRRLGDNVNSTSSSPSSSQKDKKKDVIIVVMFLFEILKFFFFHFQDCTSSNCVLFGWFCY